MRMQCVLETQLKSKSSNRTPGVTLSQTLLSKSLPTKKDTESASNTGVSPALNVLLFVLLWRLYYIYHSMYIATVIFRRRSKNEERNCRAQTAM